jgi:sugar transferase (PEP-CTERM/EpsH1 system associated)
MEDILMLAHRIPYPPDKGDKIRSFHLLRRLARDYRVHLGAFIDDRSDLVHVDKLSALCADTCLIGLTPWRARLRSATGLLTGEALTLPYYSHRRLHAWVRQVQRGCRLQAVICFSSAMAQYLRDVADGPRRIVDFVDVDSDKWRQYSDTRQGPMAWLYRREARTLLAYERAVAASADAGIFVSPNEVALFQRLAPEAGARLVAIENGVDTDYFDPHRDYANPYPMPGPVLVFTGAMDYWANIDAVSWFAQEVLPGLRQRHPDVCFAIVGARPDAQVQRLAQLPGVIVTGAVPDVRPYLAHARLAVAPLRIARGIQNKVLEALAMGRPLLATPAALAGVDLCADLPVWRAETAADMIETACAALYATSASPVDLRARDWVTARYGWETHLDRYVHLIQGAAPGVMTLPDTAAPLTGIYAGRTHD